MVKLEFDTVYEKISVLKAKRMCLGVTEAKNVVIKTCESHDARIARLNNHFILGQLKLDKDHIITGHGLIQKKDNDNNDGNSSAPRVVTAGASNGNQVGIAPSGGSARGQMGDNGEIRV